MFLLVVAVGFNSGVYSGYNVNHIDLSPVHAGTLMGLTNSVSNLFSLVSPLVVDLLEYITAYDEVSQSYAKSSKLLIVTRLTYISYLLYTVL